MVCQDETVEMDSQEAKEKGETLVCRDHLVCKVRTAIPKLFGRMESIPETYQRDWEEIRTSSIIF